MKTASINEQEVTINMYPNQVDSRVDIFSSIPSFTRQLCKLAAEHPDDVFVTELDDGVAARLPRKWVKLRPPRQNNMTDEQKAERAERMRQMRMKQMKGANGDGST